MSYEWWIMNDELWMLVLFLKWWYLFWTERELIMSYELWMMNVSTEDEIMITILKMTENSSFVLELWVMNDELWMMNYEC